MCPLCIQKDSDLFGMFEIVANLMSFGERANAEFRYWANYYTNSPQNKDFIYNGLKRELALFKKLLHMREESLSICAVDDAVIVCKGEVRHLPNGNVIVSLR